jgi:hypothetical protein
MKIILFLIVALLLGLDAYAQSELSGGIKLTSQAQIDEFHSTFPGSVMIGGDVTISGADITNLRGLTTLTSLGGALIITDNPSLESLSGLDNIEDSSILMITISRNPLLSNCAAKSICDYLALSDASVLLFGNAAGCNSISQIQDACKATVLENNEVSDFKTYPNPSLGLSCFSFKLTRPVYAKIEIINCFGCVVKIIANQQLSCGEHVIQWDTSGIPAGVYFYRLSTTMNNLSGKVVIY